MKALHAIEVALNCAEPAQSAWKQPFFSAKNVCKSIKIGLTCYQLNSVLCSSGIRKTRHGGFFRQRPWPFSLPYFDAGAAGAGVGVAAASSACLGAGAGMADAITVVAGALIATGAAVGALGAATASPPWNFTTSGTISSATMLMILISGLMAGPAVSL